MMIRDAQREIRSVFLGGFAGQLVSGTIWLLSAALGTWGTRRQAILTVVVGGVLIFPLTQLVLRAMRRPASLPRTNPLNGLAMQVAFTVPLGLPLVAAATLRHPHWFYPALMVLVGAHYLPFVFLYGMPMFAVLCALLVGGGVVLGLYVPGPFSLGGWFTGAVLVAFAFLGRGLAARDEGPDPGGAR
jgi:hypothetical protein